MLGEDVELRRTAVAAATALVTGDYRREGSSLPVPDGTVAVPEVLRSLAPRGYDKQEQAGAIAALSKHLTEAALAAVATSPERARVVAQLIATNLEPLAESTEGRLDDASRSRLQAAADSIAKATLNGFVALARHPSAEVRKSAIELLARRSEAPAQTAIVAALDEQDPEVCKTALSALWTSAPNTAPDGTLDAVLALLAHSKSWSIRSHAAAALGRLRGAKEPSKLDQTLQAAALNDSFALVREAALRSLAQRGSPALRPVLDQVMKEDAEPHLRNLARELARPAREGKP
jgi:HEAT repeat protein